MDELLPLFPLQLVLLPGQPLPLHIFEDRYKQMIAEVMRTGTEFGVVQAVANGVVRAGCTATVEQVLKEYEDGRMDLVAVGRRRFQLLSVDEERTYYRGKVAFFYDEPAPAPPSALRDAAVALYQKLKASGDNEELGELDLDEPELSFSLAQAVPDLNVRQRLLELRNERARLELLVEHLPKVAARAEETARLRVVAPKNGHSKRKLEIQ